MYADDEDWEDTDNDSLNSNFSIVDLERSPSDDEDFLEEAAYHRAVSTPPLSKATAFVGHMADKQQT